MSGFMWIQTFVTLTLCSSYWAKTLQNPFDILSDVRESPKIEYYNTSLDQQIFPNCTTYSTSRKYVILSNGSLFLVNQNRTVSESFYLRNGTAYFCSKDATLTNIPRSYNFSEDFTETITPESDNYTDNVTQTIAPISYNFSEEFQRCAHVLIDPEEYTLLKDGTIFIEIYSKSYGPLDYLIVHDGVYICVPSFEELKQNRPYDWEKFSKTSDYVTFIGLLISIVSLMSHLCTFLLVPSVRNLPGSCLASLSLSLLMAYLCFLTAFLLESEVLCVGLGMSVYYFFLTAFFWMNAIAFDVWRSFRVVTRELRITSNKVPWKRFLLYSLYCWVVPAVLTILVKVFDSTNILPDEFRPAFGHPFCWFGQRKALLLFFAVPLIIVMLLNIAFFADVIFVINRATIKSGSAQDANLRRSFAMFTRLALIMGLTWIFGIAAGFVDKPFLWYIFIVLNTLQGLFIFAVFLGSSKVRSLCSKQYRSRKRSSTSVRTISAAL